MWVEDAVGVGQGSTVGLYMYWRVLIAEWGYCVGTAGHILPREGGELPSPIPAGCSWPSWGTALGCI